MITRHRPTADQPAPFEPPAPGVRPDAEQPRVEHVEIRRAAAGESLARVQARVYLGRLVPADVRVVLVIVDGPDGGVAPRALQEMWSECPFQNGSYLFEAHVPDALVGDARRAQVDVRRRFLHHLPPPAADAAGVATRAMPGAPAPGAVPGQPPSTSDEIGP